MNRVLTVFCRKRIFPLSLCNLYYRQVFQAEACFYSSVCGTYLHRKNYQISPVQSLSRQMSLLSRLKNKFSSYLSDNVKVQRAGYLTYEKIADNIDYKEFFQCFGLPDTFQSWFSCIQLHIYMTILVTASEKHGKSFRNSLIEAMWNDVELRVDRLTKMKKSTQRKYVKELVSQFNASLIAYDEGVFSDDKVLAATFWRMLFSCKLVDPQLLENCVMYIRKQLIHLDAQNTQNIIFKGIISFLPLNNIISDDKEL